MPCDHVARMTSTYDGCPVCDRLKYARPPGWTAAETDAKFGQAISWSLSTRLAQPLTDLERAWFTDDELALRREVGPPKERSLVENLGICALGLVGGTCCMVMVAFVGYGLFDLARWVIAP